jgi:hypothetical protein
MSVAAGDEAMVKTGIETTSKPWELTWVEDWFIVLQRGLDSFP